jgi:hypothetical protein
VQGIVYLEIKIPIYYQLITKEERALDDGEKGSLNFFSGLQNIRIGALILSVIPTGYPKEKKESLNNYGAGKLTTLAFGGLLQ